MSIREKYLYGGGLWRIPRLCLLPLSILYPCISALRYRLARPRPFPFYTISLGNLVAGGTGKTPLTIYLADHFSSMGLKVGILCRGYGGKYDAPYLAVTPQTPWQLCGDEPLLMANKTSALVVVSRRRLPGAHYLQERGVDLVILDDAFSNHKLRKDYEILLLDSQCPLGNGLPLPSGLLREFPSARQRANLVVHTRVEESCRSYKPGVRYRMACDLPAPARINTYAGLGNNPAFFEGLKHMGYRINQSLSLPDHNVPTESQLQKLWTGGVPVLTSEKDFVKLPTHWQQRIAPVGLQIELLNMQPALEEMRQGIRRKLSRKEPL